MKKYMYTILLLLNVFIIYSQNYGKCYQKCNLAEIYIDKRDYKKAMEVYKEVIAQYKLAFPAYHEYGILLYKDKQYSLAADNFLMLTKLGYSMDELLWDVFGNGFSFSRDELNILFSKVQTFKTKYENELKKVRCNYNYEYNDELIKIFVKDQSARFASEFEDTAGCEGANRFFVVNDSLNLQSLKSLIAKFGMPDFAKVSMEGIAGFRICVMHCVTYKWGEQYCDSLLECIKSKFNSEYFISPQSYACIIDRKWHILNNLNFYCQFFSSGKQVYKKEELNKRREDIYLLDIKYTYPNLLK